MIFIILQCHHPLYIIFRISICHLIAMEELTAAVACQMYIHIKGIEINVLGLMHHFSHPRQLINRKKTLCLFNGKGVNVRNLIHNGHGIFLLLYYKMLCTRLLSTLRTLQFT